MPTNYLVNFLNTIGKNSIIYKALTIIPPIILKLRFFQNVESSLIINGIKAVKVVIVVVRIARNLVDDNFIIS